MSRARISTLALAVSTLCISCKKDEGPPPGYFDESGAWALVTYDLEGLGDFQDVASNRENAFLLNFDKANGVVQTAACVDLDEGQDSPNDSPCRLTPSETEWVCQCYGYAFSDTVMKWQSFDAGEVPPEVSIESTDDGAPADDGTGGGGGSGNGGSGDGGSGGDGGTAEGGGDGSTGGGGGATGATTTILVMPQQDIEDTHTFIPLPTGVFSSNGTSSRFIMEARAGSVFAEALEDPVRATCEPCL
jgi:hypothetical protein